MARKEARTDLWVARQLDDCSIGYTPQGSDVKEIDEALRTASKRGTGNAGYPEYVAVVGDFVLVIEDKADTERQLALTESGVLDLDTKAVTDYAVNGAYFYAKHIAQNTAFGKVFAVGVSGDERHHVITPLYVDDREGYKILPDVESFVSFTEANIGEYYTRCVLEEPTDVEKSTEEILRDAAELHGYLRTYGTLKDQDKPLVVAGILLALDEVEHGGFSVESLTADQTPGMRDGDKVMTAIRGRLTRSNVGPDAKRDKLLSEFSVIQTSFRLNEKSEALGKTPLRYYTEFLYSRVFRSIKYQQTSEDFIGRFYGEFMSYSGGDGQTLGIVLTPRHVTELMCDLVDIRHDDVVLDPTCGTGGFLISAMRRMLDLADTEQQRMDIRKKQLHGFELQGNMFAVACVNMILRRDGNSNLECCDFLARKPPQVQLKKATVGLMNPPYSQGSKEDPAQYEISFVKHLLDSLVAGGRAAVIVPQSSMTGKSKEERALKREIMRKHTLEGVITCNTDTFNGVGTNPVIAIFTAHEAHDPDKVCKFIDFRDDGYEVRTHVGLVEGDSAKDKRRHLLDVWFDRAEAPSCLCVESTVKPGDEWLHSFYYFNDEIPTEADFERTIGDYLTFEFSMVMQDPEYRFEPCELGECTEVPALGEKEWKPFSIVGMFSSIVRGRAKGLNHLRKVRTGGVNYVGATNRNNGVVCRVEEDSCSHEMVFEGNCVGFITNGDGAAGFAIYKAERFISTSDVLYGYAAWLNKYTGLFFVVAQDMIEGKYSHGHKRGKEHLSGDKVMLPVSGSGDPDYGYMEEYVKNVMRRKYRRFLAFLG